MPTKSSGDRGAEIECNPDRSQLRAQVERNIVIKPDRDSPVRASG